MTIDYITDERLPACCSEDNIKSCIEYYHNNPQDPNAIIKYNHFANNCISIYESCEKLLNKRVMTKSNRKKLTEFMIFFFYEFEKILSIGFNKPLIDLDDGINYNAPEYCGLYLVGETHFNPTNMDLFYCVKVGKAVNIKKRLDSYNTHCPMLYRIDFKQYNTEMLAYQAESYYQEKLKKVAIASNNHNQEWVFVDRETYLKICKKGFSYFDREC